MFLEQPVARGAVPATQPAVVRYLVELRPLEGEGKPVKNIHFSILWLLEFCLG